jgi:putative membrane protein
LKGQDLHLRKEDKPVTPDTDKDTQKEFETGPRPPDLYSDDRTLLAWHRSHLANERTFLSWARTGISLLAFGFVIERFDLFMRQWLASQGLWQHVPGHQRVIYLALISFLLAGIAISVSGIRFLRARQHINRGEAVFTILPDILVVLSVLAVVIIAVALSMPPLKEILLFW